MTDSFFKKTASILTSIFLTLGIVLLVAIGAFSVRMMFGPINLDFAKEEIEAVLSDKEKGYQVSFNEIHLTWPAIFKPILLDLKGAKIIQNDVTPLSVDHVAFGLSGFKLLTGKIVPSILIIDSPTFELAQQDDDFVFFWQSPKEKTDAAAELDNEERRDPEQEPEKLPEPIENNDDGTTDSNTDEKAEESDGADDVKKTEQADTTDGIEDIQTAEETGAEPAENPEDAQISAENGQSEETVDTTLVPDTEEKSAATENIESAKPEEESNRGKIRGARKQASNFLQQITDPAQRDKNIFTAIQRLEIINAVVLKPGETREGGNYIALANISLKKSGKGLEGDVKITMPRGEDVNSEIVTSLIYNKARKGIDFFADLKNVDPAQFYTFFPSTVLLQDLDMDFNGNVKAAFDSELRLQNATITATIDEGLFTIPDVFDTPVSLQDGLFNASFSREKGTLDVTDFKAVVGDIPIEMTTAATIERGKIHAPVEIKIAEMALDKVQAIFPKTHLNSDAGLWLTKKLSKGRFYDVVLNTDFNLIRNPETRERESSLENTRLAFKAEGVSVQYSDTLMPVTDVIGEGVYENDGLTIHGETANVGDIVGKNVDVVLTDLSVEGGGLAHITLDGSGPLQTALKYISDEPIALGEDLGFDVAKTKGNVDFNLDLTFPTLEDLPKEQVIVKLKGKLTDLLIPGIVSGLPLSGGPYDLGFEDGAISLKGSGALADRPITVEYLEYLDPAGHDYQSQIKAKITSDDYLREAFGIHLDDYISGPLPVDVVYTDKGEKAVIDVTGDVAPTTVHIDPFDYNKAPNVAGSLSLKAYMTGEVLDEIDNLTLSTKDLSLSKGRILFKPAKDGGSDISRGSLPAATLGKTKVSVDFEVMADDTLKIIAKGGVVDLGPFINPEKKGGEWKKPEDNESSQPMKISVAADTLLAHEGETLRAGKIYVELDKQSDVTRIEMDAKVGSGDMFLRFKPEIKTGNRTFRMESTDAGYTLKAFGLYDTMRGGKMVIYGQPHQGDKKGDLYGTARIEKFRVKNAPALAKLLGAMSLKGVDNLLKNDGLPFAKLESDFEWRFRNDGNLLVVKDGRTSGSELGLTFEGVVNQATDQIDVSGTVIPLSTFNNAIGDIPLIGDILTFGDALFAATYTISGPASDAKVSINPLSVLAPGFLRKILFEGSVESKIPDEKQ